MFAHAFVRHAYLAGTFVALAAGLVGYFLVQRNQVFTGDALGHVAFTGALAALAAGVDARVGLFAATVGVGVATGVLGGRGRAGDVVVGSVFAWVLGLGTLFLTLYTTSRSTANGAAGISILFGSVFGLSGAQAWVAAAIGAGACLLLLGVARPLLFASVDGAVAAARGVPVRLLGVVFLGLVGATAAEATQAVGALLLLGLLAAPAAAARRLTARPYAGMAVAAALAAASMWLGLLLGYLVPRLPPSSAVLFVAAGLYGLTLAFCRPQGRRALLWVSAGLPSRRRTAR